MNVNFPVNKLKSLSVLRSSTENKTLYMKTCATIIANNMKTEIKLNLLWTSEFKISEEESLKVSFIHFEVFYDFISLD